MNKQEICSMSERQKRIVGYGMTSIGVLGVVLLASVIVVACWFAGRQLGAVLKPLVLGLLFSCIFKNIFVWARNVISFGHCKSLEQLREEDGTDWAGIIVVVVTILVVGSLCGWVMYRFGSAIMGQVSALGSNLPVIVDNFMKDTPWLRELLQNSGVDVQALLKKLPGYFLEHTGSLVTVKDAVSTWMFAGIFCYCFLENPLRGSMIGNELKALPMFSGWGMKFFEEQFDKFCDTMTKYFPKQILINFVIEGLAGGFGLMFLGVPFGFVLGFLMGALNIIPLYGTVVVLPVVLLVAKFGNGGSVSLMVASLSIWALVQIADVVLPMVVHGKAMKLSTGVIIFSFLFWGAVISPIWGMILAIPLSAFSIGLWRSLKGCLAHSLEEENGNVRN